MANQSYNNSQPPREFFSRPENRNLLSPNGFIFSIGKMRSVDFFCQSASVPSISMKPVETPTRFNRLPQPGDELYYEELRIKFLVDENMKNYYQVHDWMRTLATPVSSREFTFGRGSLESQNKDLENSDLANYENQWRSDCSLFILSSNYQPVAEFVFRDAFPTSLTTLNFDSAVQDIQYFTAECALKYSYFDYYVHEAATATDASMPVTYRKTALGTELIDP